MMETLIAQLTFGKIFSAAHWKFYVFLAFTNVLNLKTDFFIFRIDIIINKASLKISLILL